MSEPVTLWRNEQPTSLFGPPYEGTGRFTWETVQRPALSTEYRALPVAEFDALVAEVERWKPIMDRLREQREFDVRRYEELGGRRSELSGERTFYLDGETVDAAILAAEDEEVE